MAFMCGSAMISAQDITGRVIDAYGDAIEAAAVILQTADSMVVDACVTDSLGRFAFSKAPEHFVLMVQQLSYKPKTVAGVTRDIGDVVLEEDSLMLQQATVRGYSSIMSVSDAGGLEFSSDKLKDGRPVTNAIDLLKEIPCLEKTGSAYNLVGTSRTAITINGHKSKMSYEQILALLSSLPAEDIKAIELFYKSPAKTGINGASINFVLNKKRADLLDASGMISASDIKSHFHNPSTEAFFSIYKSKFSFEVGYTRDWAHDYTVLNLFSDHTIRDQLYIVTQKTIQNQRGNDNGIFSRADYDFNENSNLSIQFSGSYGNSSDNTVAKTKVSDIAASSSNEMSGNTKLSDVSVEYVLNDFEIGGEVLLYKQTNRQYLHDAMDDSDLSSVSSQTDKIFKVYVQNCSELGKRNNLSYGVDWSSSVSNNDYSGVWSVIHTDDSFSSQQYEYAVDLFAEWDHIISGGKGRFSMALKAEYSQSIMDEGGTSNTLWEGFDFYPSFSLTYGVKKNSFVQLSLSTDKTYPSYWQTTSGRTYLSPYCVTEGNPGLLPYLTYHFNANYIISRRYVIGLFAESSPRYSAQLLYQDPDELISRYRYYNMKSSDKLGILAVVPFSIGSWNENSITLNSFYMRQYGEFESEKFDRNTIGGRVSMTSNIYFNSDRTLSAQLSGWYQLPAIQGIYDIKQMANISASITWEPPKTSLSFVLMANDIFKTYLMGANTVFKSQKYRFENNMDVRYIGLTVKYTFNNFSKKSNTVDTDRLGGL